MAFNMSMPSLIWRLFLQALLFGATGILILKEEYVYAALCLFLAIFLVFTAIRLFNQSNRSVAYFFNAIRNHDFSIRFQSDVKNKNLSLLHQNLNLVTKHLQELKLQNEYKERYYYSLIQESTSGLVVLSGNEQVKLINAVACDYARIPKQTVNPDLLKIKNPDFYSLLCRLNPGESLTYRNASGNSVRMLLFHASSIRSGKEELKVISIQDISHELDTAEIGSYQKLISILTHEMMNSVTPLLSVSRSLQKLHAESELPPSPEEKARTTLNGLRIIEQQSDGLLNFIQNYRKLSKIPAPVITSFNIKEWMEQVVILYSEKTEKSGVSMQYSIDPEVDLVHGDRNLLNQVITNILNNAFDALAMKESPRKIEIRVTANGEGRVNICISNNGPAIPSDLQEKIFVPFFTTKEGGSGIGLSLSRQIMILHKGALSLIPNQADGTSFVMEL